MRMTRQILIQMAIFAVIATTALAIMVLVYMRLPAFLGVGQYRVTWSCPRRAGCTRGAMSPTAALRSAR